MRVSAGRSRATRSGRVSSSPASRVVAAAGKWLKSMTLARGSFVSRPVVAGLMLASGSGWRSSRPKPSSVRICPTPVRLSGLPSAASRRLISWIDRPSRRSWMTRPRAASFFGAFLRPGLPGSAKSVSLPARKSRTSDASADGVYPNRAAALGQRRALQEVGAHRLVPSLVGLCRTDERFPALSRGWFRCHAAGLPRELLDGGDVGGRRADNVSS